ncbi:hypothetical protein L195_g018210 [Trifolium pratense]|uniref:Uncharacterized protein n=1 Tax=Trifolium pratense TaxID=57577 RepID=A0A2K3MW41_TRIPR|nr:hypothetical protein L195_g018210 [Trifolium pratense]
MMQSGLQIKMTDALPLELRFPFHTPTLLCDNALSHNPIFSTLGPNILSLTYILCGNNRTGHLQATPCASRPNH